MSKPKAKQEILKEVEKIIEFLKDYISICIKHRKFLTSGTKIYIRSDERKNEDFDKSRFMNQLLNDILNETIVGVKNDISDEITAYLDSIDENLKEFINSKITLEEIMRLKDDEV